MLDHLLTEQPNPASAAIDTVSTEAALRIINREDAKVAEAVERVIPAIARAVDAIADAMARGGRLFYIGAGTSGRLGVLDAAEIPPTFGAPPDASPINLGAATLQVLNDGTGSGGTIALGNSITLNAAATTDTINVGNNGSGHTGNIVAFGALNNGTPANAFVSTFNFTGANGYLLSFSSLGLPGSGGNNTTLNPTTTSVIISNVVNQETLFSGHYDTVFLSGTSTGNVINGVISDSSGYTSVGNGDTRVTMTGVGWTLSGV